MKHQLQQLESSTFKKPSMKFTLLFLSKGKSPWGKSCAYVCVSECVGYGENEKDPRFGHQMLTSESMSETECHKKIDGLIEELVGLKAMASRKFKNKA